MDAKGSDISSGLARNPEHAEVAVVVEVNELALVDGADTELTLDGGNQGGSLEESAGKGLESLGEGALTTLDLVMESDNADVFLSGALLRLDKPGSAINTNNCGYPSLVSVAKLVVRGIAKHVLKQPVTLGSSVPECPVFSTLFT